MWDWDFWVHYLERMAEEKYNVLSLWSLNPFPSMVDIPEFPDASVEDVMGFLKPKAAQLSGYGIYDGEKRLYPIKKMTIKEKIDFWKRVMAYAKSLCIDVMIFTWNVFTYGTEGMHGGISADPCNPECIAYMRAAVRTLIQTYPDLKGLGITCGENLWQDHTDIPFLAATYGMGVKDALAKEPGREFHFINRMHFSHYQEIIEAFGDLPCHHELSFKYSQAHMFSAVKPHFIDSFLLQKDPDIPLWLTIRNDDFYMLRWADEQFLRSYLRGMPEREGMYIGADGFTWANYYLDTHDEPSCIFDRFWYFFAMWGALSYDPHTGEKWWQAELATHFGISADELGPLLSLWADASRLIPLQQCVHWHDFDFQWYPEGCCLYLPQFHEIRFANLNEFVQGHAIPGGDYVSIEEYCKGRRTHKQNPAEVAKQMIAIGESGLKKLDGLVGRFCRKEAIDTLRDIRSMLHLGLYYGYKIQAAIALYRIRYQGRTEEKAVGIQAIQSAIPHWLAYTADISERFKPQFLGRLCGLVDIPAFNKEAIHDVAIMEQEEVL